MGKTQQLGMYPNIGISSSGTPTTNYLPKFTGASTIGNSLIYDDGSTLGIGLSSLGAWDSTIRAMEIGTKGNFYGGFNGGASVVYIGTNAYYNGGWKYANTSAYKPQLLDAGGGNWHFQNAATGTAGNAITWITLMKITDTGNVGIGTSSPSALLHAYSSTTGTQTIAKFGAANYASAASKTYIQIGTQYDDGSSRIGSSNPSGNLSELFFETATATSGVFAERMRITSSGKVLINTTTTTSQDEMFTVRGEVAITYLTDVTRYRQLYYSGNNNFYFYNGSNNAYLSSAGAWTNASDITIKKDIEDLKYGLNEVLLLKPRIYKMKSNDLIQVGFIAQEIEEVIPELVDEDDKGMKGLSYGQLTAVLTKALQESNQIIKDLEARIVTLESKIN